MKSSWSESLSWKKGRNKHNLNYHSRRVVACCSGIKQAGRQVAGPNYRQLEAASRSIWERWSCLWPRPGLCFSTWGTNRAAASHGGSRQSQAAPRELDFSGSSCPRQDKESPFLSEQPPCCVPPAARERPRWVGDTWAGVPAALHPEGDPNTSLLAAALSGERELTRLVGLRAFICLLRDFKEHLHHSNKVPHKIKEHQSPEQKVAFLSVPSGRGDKRSCNCYPASLRVSILHPYTQAA